MRLRSADLDLDAQVKAAGATWIDRQFVARGPRRSAAAGSAPRCARRWRADRAPDRTGTRETAGGGRLSMRATFSRLRDGENSIPLARSSQPNGNALQEVGQLGEYVTGLYRQRIMLASGRFAMIDEGLGFQLVPWSPSLERNLGKHVSGVARADGGIDWSFGRQRGLGL